MSNWQPIETAPTDGTHVLLYARQQPHEEVCIAGPFVLSGYWDSIDGSWCSPGSSWVGPFYDATHWMPLPTPPKGQG